MEALIERAERGLAANAKRKIEQLLDNVLTVGHTPTVESTWRAIENPAQKSATSKGTEMSKTETLLKSLEGTLSVEQLTALREHLAAQRRKYTVNSNVTDTTIVLADGTSLKLGVGKKSRFVRVYGLRHRLPIALPVARWGQLAEAMPLILDFIAKNEQLFGNPAAVPASAPEQTPETAPVVEVAPAQVEYMDPEFAKGLNEKRARKRK